MTVVQCLPTEREQLVDYVRRWGGGNTDAILDKTCQLFSIPQVIGVIGYRIESGHAIVYGEPICAQADKIILAKAFEEYCHAEGLGVVYTIISEEFASQVRTPPGGVLIQFGEQLLIDPSYDPKTQTGSKAVLVRKKIKRAASEGVVIHEYTGNDPKLEREIEQIAESWLQSRHGMQVFIAHITLFADRNGKRWFYAKCGDKIVGIMLLNKVEGEHGWLLNNLMITQDAPNGTSELLVVATLRVLHQEKCRQVIYGPIPSKQLGKIDGLGTLSTWLTLAAYQVARKAFRLDGHGTFWEKFQPSGKPSYILFNERRLSIGALRGLLRAFNASS